MVDHNINNGVDCVGGSGDVVLMYSKAKINYRLRSYFDDGMIMGNNMPVVTFAGHQYYQGRKHLYRVMSRKEFNDGLFWRDIPCSGIKQTTK